MEFLKIQITRIQEQLAGLSATQKMLVVSLLTIMVMTLLWWAHWAAVPEMSPLLDQSLSQDELGQITTTLETQAIPHQIVGDKILVPADRKLEVLAVLGFSQALPRNFDQGFNEMTKQMNWLDSPDKTEKMFLEERQQLLASIIRRFPGVQDAAVVIDPTTERRLDGNDVQPVATVMVTTSRNSTTVNRQLADAVAGTVSGAQAGLARSNINVTIDGVPYAIKDRSDDEMGSDDGGVELQKQWEDHYRDTILQGALQDIRGAIVGVTVKVNTSQTVTTKHTVDPKQTVSVPTRTEETTDEQTAEPAAQQEAGAVPNTAMSLPTSGGGGGGSTSSSDKSEFDTDHGKLDVLIKQGPGDATLLAASVRIPRTYFIQAYKNENGGKDPDDPTALTAYMNAELLQIRGAIKGCAPVTDDALFVGSYSDVMPTEAPVEQQAAASPFSGAVGRHGKEIGVGLLAALSLFMVSMMVRKGVPATATATSDVLHSREERTLDGNETVVGEASENVNSLDGMELDSETVKAQQVVDQVQQMVKSNPDAAANLVKRWLNR
ncbi:MAG: flagellar M-ring protein FliF C-terminal domain-containing protein [Tepidisphaeraceae bacterium]|jgi:flagellar biosynthesis/type III secretory pathway M-ring protein FliF/YscJ